MGDDLTLVLSNVAADARPTTREKIANSAETRAFLEVGLLLLRDDLLDHRGPDLLDDHDAGTCLFAGLSQARLIERAGREDARTERPRMLTVGMFRDRWRYKSRYTEDLIAYLLRPTLTEEYIGKVRRKARTASPAVPLPQLIRELVDAVLSSTVEDPLWSLQTMVWVALPNHPRVQTFLKVRYEHLIAEWADIFEELGGVYGLRLQPGHTWRDVSEMVNSLSDGARVRARAMGSVASLSSGENVVLGAILTMMSGLFVDVPAGTPAL
jgi:hypothetical protein